MDKGKLIKAALKGRTSNVKVVNTPSVKIVSDNSMPKEVPTLRITDTDLPAIKNWKVGNKYKLTLEVQQTSLNQGDDFGYVGSDNSKQTRASFKVLSVKEG